MNLWIVEYRGRMCWATVLPDGRWLVESMLNPWDRREVSAWVARWRFKHRRQVETIGP